jgi:hypothetical protein
MAQEAGEACHPSGHSALAAHGVACHVGISTQEAGVLYTALLAAWGVSAGACSGLGEQGNECYNRRGPLQHAACLMLFIVSVVTADAAPFLAQRVGGCCVEDVKQFLLECPAYHHLRARYPCVFGDAMPDGTTQSEQLRLLSIFDCDQQDQLAHVVYTMIVLREHCLSLPHGSHIAIANVQQIVEEDVELTRIQYTLSLVTHDV